MADLLTVYDDGEANSFIDCTICDKRIRGDTNYKIHLTTLQHLKREKTLADKGLIPKPAPWPQWTSIKQYLTYLNLNEPIIGLGDLVQEDDLCTTDGKSVLRYRCRLCTVQMDLFDMATHVVGRRHRQKYLERYRPDMVTWEKTSEKQAGVVARAKAALVEKQEGWGNPMPLFKSAKRPLRNQGAAQDRPTYAQGRAPSGLDRKGQDFYNQSYMEGDSYGRQSHDHEDNQYNRSYRDEVPHQPSVSGDNRYNAPFSEDGRQRRSYQEKDYVDRHFENEMNVGSFPDDRDRRYMDKGDPHPYDDEWYPETNPSRGPYKSREGDDYHHGNISENKFGKSGTDYQASGRMQEPMYMSYHGTGPSMDERQRQSRNLPFSERGRDRFQDVDETGSSGPFEMHGYNRRQGYDPADDDIPAKKKRKTRFSDASPLELALARKSQLDEVISKYKPKGRAVPIQNQASGYNMDSEVTPRMENVLDVLNDIQVENVQEANFLKDKLCALLKEFQSNKAQRAQGQLSHSSADFTDSYHGGNKMEPRRDMPDLRRFDDQGFQEASRYDRDLRGPRDYLHARHVEDPKVMRQNRGPEEPEYQWDPYREVSVGRPEERMARHPDDRRGYREGGDLYDPFEPSSSPPLETGSSTLDKLASTLLELVARKTN